MAENAAKCSAADGVTQTFDFYHGTPLMVRAVDFNALHAECQKLRKDAERYRWLQANMMGVIHLLGRPGIGLSGVTGDGLNAQVDAAMLAAPCIGAA
jgi:hypothetical protein